MTRRGFIAKNEDGEVGLICSDTPELLPSREKGKKEEYWVGILLKDTPNGLVGDPWRSKNPTIYGKITQYVEEFLDETS